MVVHVPVVNSLFLVGGSLRQARRLVPGARMSIEVAPAPDGRTGEAWAGLFGVLPRGEADSGSQ